MITQTVIVTVTCPVCEVGRVDCRVDPGEPAEFEPGYMYPGTGPSVEDFDASCKCHLAVTIVREDAYMDALLDRALSAAGVA